MATKGSKKNRVRRTIRKLELIIAAGGKCQICGYEKNISSLVFHHMHEKFMHLSGRYLISNKLSSVQEEVKRCALLCHNCHNELHNPHLTKKNVNKILSGVSNGVFTLSEAFEFFFIFKEKDASRD